MPMHALAPRAPAGVNLQADNSRNLLLLKNSMINPNSVFKSKILFFDKPNLCDSPLYEAGLHSGTTSKTGQPSGIRLGRFCITDGEF